LSTSFLVAAPTLAMKPAQRQHMPVRPRSRQLYGGTLRLTPLKRLQMP
jgi:hypothetical protein